MKIPNYIDALLGYQIGNKHRAYLIHQITDYEKYPFCIVPYLYRIDLEKYRYPSCFRIRIERFCKWCRRMGADAKVHIIYEDGWNTYAVMSITDPVALALEKAGLILKG